MSDPIGFIGLGQMGFAIAQNALQSGYPLRVFNRTPDKAKPLADEALWSPRLLGPWWTRAG